MNTRLALVVAGAVMAMGLDACTAGFSASFDRLPAPSRAAYERCWEHMRQPICGSTSDIAEVTNCSRSSSSTYAAQGSESERQEWLTSHGCPRNVASSGGQR
jgi:hypothetical protein